MEILQTFSRLLALGVADTYQKGAQARLALLRDWLAGHYPPLPSDEDSVPDPGSDPRSASSSSLGAPQPSSSARFLVTARSSEERQKIQWASNAQ